MTTITVMLGRWFDRTPSRLLDRLAARRMISHVIGPLSAWRSEGRAKNRDEMIIEAWLWRRYGDRTVAEGMERMIRQLDKIGEW